MALEAYVPSHIEFDTRPVEEVFVVTLYDADGPQPRGSMTTPHAPMQGSRGALTFVGRRDGKEWQVEVEDVSVTNRTALGCEYAIEGAIRRTVLREFGAGTGPHVKGLEERFDIR